MSVTHFPVAHRKPLTEAGIDSDLTVINAAAKLIGQSTQPNVAISSMLRLLSQMLGLNRGRVMQPMLPQEKMSIQYSYGLTDLERARGVYQFGEGISGKVMSTGREVVVQEIGRLPRRHGLRRRGEADQVGEEDGQVALFRGDLAFAAAHQSAHQ